MTEENKDVVVDASASSEVKETKESIEKLNADLKEKQEEYKKLRDEGAEQEEVANKRRALEKTQEKIDALKNPERKEEVHKSKNGYEFSADDVFDLREAGYRKDTDEAIIIKKFIDAGFAKDVSEALSRPSVKAELEAIKAKSYAKSVLDENDEAGIKSSRKDIRERMKDGYVPTDKTEIKQAAASNIKDMGL